MTVVSINTDSPQQNPSVGTRQISEAEMVALTLACSKLLQELDTLAKLVEVLKVAPWHGYGHPNIFDVKAVLSMHGDNSAKVEAKRTFEHSVSRQKPDWDLEALPARIASEMKREICNMVQNRILELTRVSDRWKKFLPKNETA